MKLEILRGAERIDAEADPGRTLAEALCDAGLPLNMACAGNGVCERCAVVLLAGEYDVDGRRVRVAAGERREALSCRVRPAAGPLRVEVPARALLEERGQIHDDFVLPPFLHSPRSRVRVLDLPAPTLEHPAPDAERLERALRQSGEPDGPLHLPLEVLRDLPAALREGGGRVTATVGPYRGHARVTRVAPGDTSSDHLAVAADIGTTTVVCALVDLASGRILARAADYNQQIRKADDVASRISFCRAADDVDLMRRLIVEETLNPLVHRLCARVDAAPARIGRMAVSGNTVMMHLLLGLPPASIGALPFQPVVARHAEYRAADLGLDLARTAVLDVVPSVSGYVGGDIVSDIHASRLLDRTGLVMLVDIGTNGEMVLWDGRRLRATATAAGPAFEGAGLRHGCRASEGAIEHVACGVEGPLLCSTIGKARPIGLCGSAMIDFVAQLFRAGLLNAAGRYDLGALRARGLHREVAGPAGPLHACLVAPAAESAGGEELYVTEADVAEVLKAKAAIYAGMKTLLAECGRGFADLDGIVLAGGFARHIHLRHAAWMGLLPDLPPAKFHVVGNGSLAGAYLALVDGGAFPAFDAIARRAEIVELNLTKTFESNYVDALMIPNLEPDAFGPALAEMGM